MKTIHQYVNNKTGQRYYYSTRPVICNKCEEQITDFVAVHLNWNKKKSEVFELCFDCSAKYKPESQVEEKFIMCVVKKRPRNTNLVLITPPELKDHNKDSSIFCNNLDAPILRNKANRFGHPEFTVLDDSAPVRIGKELDEDVEINKNKLLSSESELDSLIIGFKDEEICIDYDDGEVKKIRGEQIVLEEI